MTDSLTKPHLINVTVLRKELNVLTKTLTRWERLGWLKHHSRTKTGRRLYSPAVVARAKMIASWIDSGLTLNEIDERIKKESVVEVA